MTTEEIKQYLQIGCNVQMHSGFYVLVQQISPNGFAFKNDVSNIFDTQKIKEIKTWPIPNNISYGWIKFKEPDLNPSGAIQFISEMKSYVNKWQKVIGELYPQTGCIINREPEHNLPDGIGYWKIRKEWITDWRPLPPEEYNAVSLYVDLIKGDEIKFTHSSPWIVVTNSSKRPDGDMEITYLRDDGNESMFIARKGTIYSARRKKYTNSTYKYEDIKPGWWVKIGTQEQIRKKLLNKHKYTYNYTEKKIQECSDKWHRALHLSTIDVTVEGNWYWEKDFIVDISPFNPDLNSRIVLTEQEATENLAVGNSITIKSTTSQTTIKEEDKIMLNTVEEIKKLDPANLKEAAKKVKEERDNDEVKAAREKLTHLLDCETALKKKKEAVDKELAEVQELIKAFEYPPK